MHIGPSPRYRIYSRLGDYVTILSSLLSRKTQVGEDPTVLEKTIVERNQIQFAQCTPTARVAIYLAVKGIIQPRQKVILSPYTISDVVNMVICAGGIPVFTDLAPGTCNIAPEEIAKCIDSETGAVLITHLHGLSCDMEQISSICQAADVPLIEDAAQAFGARYKGQPLGTFGKAGIYSFGMYKNVNSFLGGMLVTSDKQLYSQVREVITTYPYQQTAVYLKQVISGMVTDIATWPPLFKLLTFPLFRYIFLHDLKLLNKQVTFDHNPERKTEIPHNYLQQLTPLQARLIQKQLPLVEANSQKRIEHAKIYYEGLRNIAQITLPPLRTDGSHIYTYFPIQVRQRTSLLKHLMQNGCDVAAQHLRNCADLPCFSGYYRDCPVAKKTAEQVVLLPTYPRYGITDIERNIRVIQDYYKG